MAAVEEDSLNGNAKSTRLSCKSTKSVKDIIDKITSIVDSVADRNAYASDEEKQRFKERFREIYSSAYRENILVDGKPVTDLEDGAADGDIISEIEPFDESKKQFITQEILPKVDTAVVRTAKKRKHAPHDTAYHYAKYCKSECLYLSKLKADPVVEPLQAVESPNDLVGVDKEMVQDMSRLLKEVPCVLQEAEETDQVLARVGRHATPTDGVIFPTDAQ